MLRRVLCCVTLLTSLVEGQETVIASANGSPLEVITDDGSPSYQLDRIQVDNITLPLHRTVNIPKTSGSDFPAYKVEDKTINRPRRTIDKSRSGGVDWNIVVDKVFTLARVDILTQGKDVIPISDVHKNFQRRIGIFKVNGRFFANQGTLRNLTSFRRTADVSASREQGEVYSMVCVLTLDELKLRFEHYELDVLRLGPRGYLEGTADRNTISMTLNFALVEEGCLTTLKEVKLTELVGLRMKLSGFGELDSLGSAIATWIVEQKKAEIVEGVERVLKREIENVLKDFQCDEYSGIVF